MVVNGTPNGDDLTGVRILHGELGEPCFLFKLNNDLNLNSNFIKGGHARPLQIIS